MHTCRTTLYRRSVISHGVRGFTIIELMVTIAILAILAAIAAPSLRQFLVRNSFESAALTCGERSRGREPKQLHVGWSSHRTLQRRGTEFGLRSFRRPIAKGTFVAGDTVGAGTDIRRAEKLLVGTNPSNLSLGPRNHLTAPHLLQFLVRLTGTSSNKYWSQRKRCSLPLCVPSNVLSSNNCRGEIVVDVVGRVRVNVFTKSI